MGSQLVRSGRPAESDADSSCLSIGDFESARVVENAGGSEIAGGSENAGEVQILHEPALLAGGQPLTQLTR